MSITESAIRIILNVVSSVDSVEMIDTVIVFENVTDAFKDFIANEL